MIFYLFQSDADSLKGPKYCEERVSQRCISQTFDVTFRVEKVDKTCFSSQRILVTLG